MPFQIFKKENIAQNKVYIFWKPFWFWWSGVWATPHHITPILCFSPTHPAAMFRLWDLKTSLIFKTLSGVILSYVSQLIDLVIMDFILSLPKYLFQFRKYVQLPSLGRTECWRSLQTGFARRCCKTWHWTDKADAPPSEVSPRRGWRTSLEQRDSTRVSEETCCSAASLRLTPAPRCTLPTRASCPVERAWDPRWHPEI